MLDDVLDNVKIRASRVLVGRVVFKSVATLSGN